MIRNIIFSSLVLVLIFLYPSISSAQDSLTLSVSPTLFDMSVEKSQAWKSNIKIVNVNKYDLTIYLDVVNFVPRGENGEVSFIPISDTEQDGSTLAEWFQISHEPFTIPREQTLEIPFTINVPDNAAPGGHYSAIMVGTKPPQENTGQTKVQTSQVVTSLVFARVAGDVIESGSIREFRTTGTFLNNPEATFELRFENKGNVYIQPQGEIKITNMWGQERGIIPINQNSHYGKVPHKTQFSDGIRKFTFTWKGEWSVSDIGRYTAVATLAYGSDSRQFATAKTNFWVIPLKMLLIIISLLIGFFLLISWLVRLYIRKMLNLAGIDVEDYKVMKQSGQKMSTRYANNRDLKIHAPVKAEILDLKTRLETSKGNFDYIKIGLQFCYQNKHFFLGLALVIILVSIAVWYVKNANTEQRPFEVVYVNSDNNDITVSSKEIINNKTNSKP